MKRLTENFINRVIKESVKKVIREDEEFEEEPFYEKIYNNFINGKFSDLKEEWEMADEEQRNDSLLNLENISQGDDYKELLENLAIYR